MSSFWEGFFQLPMWFIITWLSIVMIGIFMAIYELANRKMSITKAGVTFDRLRPKRDGWLFHKREQKKKVPLEEG